MHFLWAAFTTAATSADPGSVLLQYGAIGAMLVVLGLFAKAQIKREQDRGDRLEQRLEERDKAIQEKYVPTLEANTATLKEVVDLLRAERNSRR